MRGIPVSNVLAHITLSFAVCLPLAACSRPGNAGDDEPNIPEGQCIVSGISIREHPDRGT